MSAANPASRWDAGDYARNAAFVPALGAPVVELLAPQKGERILDLGCGEGALAGALAPAGAEVVAVDASPEMVAAARKRGLDAHVADGQALGFRGEFDAVFTNAALHWMLDPRAVAEGVFRALKPGGRYVGEMGGAGNVAAVRAAVRAEIEARGYTPPAADPQWYPTIDEFDDLHRAGGFARVEAAPVPRPPELPAGLAQWFRTFRTGFLDSAAIPDSEQDAVAEGAARRLEATHRRADGVWVGDYVRLRFSMRKPD